MGLLTSGPLEENIEAVMQVYRAIGSEWSRTAAPVWGFDYLDFSKISISQICLLGEKVFTDAALPSSPGPFKRAAALCILTHLFLKHDIRPRQGADFLTPDDRRDWKSRLALATVPAVLANCEIKIGDKWQRLSKTWGPATTHLRLELLNWLRWLVIPIEGDTKISIARIYRMVLALSMVIEQSYYIAGNQGRMTCDVMNMSHDCMQVVTKDMRALFDLLSATTKHKPAPR